MKQQFITIFLMMFTLHFTFSQSESKRTFEGQVYDLETKQPLAYASISVRYKGIGVLSNIDGDFKMSLESKYINDTILISFIGYKTQKIAAINNSGYLSVGLEREAYELTGVTVVPFNEVALLEKAIVKIEENYGMDHVSTCFYRLKGKSEETYCHLSESVFEYYHPGYNVYQDGLIRLNKMREIRDVELLQNIEIGASPKSFFRFDIVKEIEKSKIFGKRGLKNHIFKYKGMIRLNGRVAYQIDFDQKENLKRDLFKGSVYIDTTTLAFIKIDYGFSPIGVRYVKFANPGIRAMLRMFGIYIQQFSQDISTTYQKIGKRWYMKDAIYHTSLYIDNNPKDIRFPFDASVIYMISNIETDNISTFNSKEVMRRGESFERQEADPDPEFWKDYNIIPGEVNFKEVQDRINEDLESTEVED